jgi:hypothetical protein
MRRKLFGCVAAVVLTASGSLGAASSSGIYLSTWGTAHVTFGEAFKAWLKQSGATVTADAPMTLDADRGGFTMPASSPDGDHLDLQGRMVYPGDLTVTVPVSAPPRTSESVLRFGPFYLKLMPQPTWTAGLSVDGTVSATEFRLASGDTSEVLAGGGSPSPSGFRAAAVPFHLTPEATDLLARQSGRPGPVAGSLFGTLSPRFDHVPTGG